MAKKKITPSRFARIMSIIVGVVLVWRGIWYVLDELDILIWGGSHIFTAIGGIILGLIILYIPDKDLKEIEKL